MPQIEFHPLAELFPLMEGADFDALAADIKAHGLREPIILHEEKILDGRNRYRACDVTGVDPVFHPWDGEGTPHEFVISKNIHRRHLNESQRAIIAAKLANLKHGEVGRGHEKSEQQIRVSDAAELLNVGTTSVQNAKTVMRDGTPEELAAIQRGDLGVNRLADQIRAKSPAKERAKKRAEPMSQSGKNPERIQRQQLNAEIWGRIKDALIHLTSLPLPDDAAAIARTNDRAGFVDARLSKATEWLKEFSDAWNAK